MQLTSAEIQSVWTRILVPFWIEPLGGSAERLLEVETIQRAFQTADDPSISAWRFSPKGSGKIAPSAYMVEYSDHALQFLFDGIGKTGCHYLRYEAPASKYPLVGSIQVSDKYRAMEGEDSAPNRPSLRGWQHVLGTGWKKDGKWAKDRPMMTLGDATSFRPEIWLSRVGVGVLSIPLLFQANSGHSIDLSQLMDAHHALATAQKSVSIGLSGDSELHLDFHEYVGQLASPLQVLGRVCCDSRAMVYTTLELTKTASDFADQVFSAEVLQILGHLAQVHPSSHCGGHYEVNGMTINNEHSTVVDLAGFAHAVLQNRTKNSDRQKTYSGQRAQRTQFAYFPAALLALMQRLVIAELLRRATGQALKTASGSSSKITEIRRLSLAFSLEGEFLQVAQRSTIQKYHELAQKSCEVQQGLHTIQGSLEGFHQIELEEQGQEREEEAKRAEQNSEIIECFLASVYSVAVAYYLSAAFHIPHNLFAGLSMVLLQLATVVTVIIHLRRPGKTNTQHTTPAKSRWPGGLQLIALLFLYIAIFIAANLFLNNGHVEKVP